MNYYQVKLIKILLADNKTYQWLAFIWTAIVGFLCLVSFNSLPTVSLSNSDKLGHFVFHFGITILWYLYFRISRNNENKMALLKAFLFSFFYGCLLEILQANFTTTRKGDINDVMANSIGAGLAIVLLLFTAEKAVHKIIEIKARKESR